MPARLHAALPGLRHLLTITAALGIVLAGLVATAPQADAGSARWEKIQTARKIALNQIGDPYRYGAAGPGRFDCSGLIQFATHRAGMTNVPRTSQAQANFMTRIKKSNMKAGDFMFFHNGGSVYHVAMFAGWRDGRRIMVHAPSSGKTVHRAKPWTSQWYAGTLRF